MYDTGEACYIFRNLCRMMIKGGCRLIQAKRPANFSATPAVVADNRQLYWLYSKEINLQKPDKKQTFASCK
jgi:hypothetical protein